MKRRYHRLLAQLAIWTCAATWTCAARPYVGGTACVRYLGKRFDTSPPSYLPPERVYKKTPPPPVLQALTPTLIPSLLPQREKGEGDRLVRPPLQQRGDGGEFLYPLLDS